MFNVLGHMGLLRIINIDDQIQDCQVCVLSLDSD